MSQPQEADVVDCCVPLKLGLSDLKRQKRWLIEHLPWTDEIEGLISLLDAIQDYLVDEMGFPVERVFNVGPLADAARP